MKIKILILCIISNLTIFTLNWYSNQEEQILVNWHAYKISQNNPIVWLDIYITKNWNILWRSKTNNEWYYSIIMKNIDWYINICINSEWIEWLSNNWFCQTTNSKQEIWKVINDISVRTLKYDFFISEKWENMNQLYEDEITYKSYEEKIEEIEIEKQRIAEEKRLEEIKKQKETEEKKEIQDIILKYKMPPIKEIIAPLETVKITWVINNKSIWWDNIDYSQVNIKLYSKNINKTNPLVSTKVNNDWSFELMYYTENSNPVIEPLVFAIESYERKKTWDILTPKYNNIYRPITNEINAFNLQLEENKILNWKIYIKKYNFQKISILFLIIAYIGYLYNKNYSRRENILKKM